MLDICLNKEDQQFQREIENIIQTSFGLDYCVEESRQTLLHILATKPEFSRWSSILKCFINVDVADAKLQTPLHVSIISRNVKACKALIENSASPTVEDEHGINPIQLACQNNYPEIMEILFGSFLTKRYCCINIHSICRLCIESNSVDSLQVIVSQVPIDCLSSHDEEGKALIHYASFSSNFLFLQVLLERGVDINQKTKKASQKLEKTEKTSEFCEKAAIDLTESIPSIEFLLSKGAKYSTKDPRPIVQDVIRKVTKWAFEGRSIGPSPLHNAVKDNTLHIIKTHEGKVDIRDLYNKTPLMEAIEKKNLAAVNALLEKGADPAFFTEYSTAFHIAALNGFTEALIEFMKDMKLDIMKEDSKGRSIFVCAVASGNIDTLKIVCNGRTLSHKDYGVIIDMLLSMKNEELSSTMCEVLIKSGLPTTELTKSGRSLLLESIVLCKASLALVLLSHTSLSQNDADNYLVEAILHECNIVEKLLEMKANPSMYKGSPLHLYTTTHKSNNALLALINYKKEMMSESDNRDNTYLHIATKVGNPRAIEDSFKYLHIEANTQNADKNTAIHLLMQNESSHFKENYQMLIQNNANIFLVNSKGQNILHVAAENGNSLALEALLSPKSDSELPLLSENDLKELIDQKDNNQLTPLETSLVSSKNDIYLAQKKQECALILTKKMPHPIFDCQYTIDGIKKFIQRGLSPNLFDKNGTPLITSIILQYKINGAEITRKMVKLLLENGVNPSMTDLKEETPFHHSIRLNDIELCRDLMDAGSSFLIGRPLNVICEELNLNEIALMIKNPLRKACAALELLDTQTNSVREVRAALELLTPQFRELPTISTYICDMLQIMRLMDMFAIRLKTLVWSLKPSTQFGGLFLYFVDAFMTLVNLSSSYCIAKADIDRNPTLTALLSSKCELSRNSLGDLIIVPVQIMTRLPDLVEAVVKPTPADHIDMENLKRAHLKFASIALDTNERQLIFESQKKLQALNMFVNLNGQQINYFPNDVLLAYDHFTKINYVEPPSGTDLTESLEWGLRPIETTSGDLKLIHFKTVGQSLKSFIDSEHLVVFLFRKFVLFGLFKGETNFKLKFSCRTSEVLWDFSNKHGSDAFIVWTPIGQFHLKIFLKNGQTGGDFLKKQWKTAAVKLYQVDDQGDQSIDGMEICYVSWVGAKTKCVHSKKFYIRCQTKKDGREKILNKLKELKVEIETYISPEGNKENLILFDFQTHKPAQEQMSDILSDIEVK